MKASLIINRKDLIFRCAYLVFVLYMFHMVRGVFSVYPLLVLCLCLFVSGWALVRSSTSQVDINGLLLVGCLVVYSLLVIPVISFIRYPEELTATAMARFVFILPVLLLALGFSDVQQLRKILKFYVFFLLLCSFSVFYQIKFGAVSWFAEASYRDGLVRYSSLAGSLTILGVAGGLALPFAYFLIDNKIVKYTVLVFIAIGMLVSLQKAAVINLVIFSALVFWSLLCRGKIGLVLLLVSGIASFVALLYYFDVSYAVSVVNNVFRVGATDEVHSDYSISESIVSRLWGLPSVVLDFHGPFSLIFGVGLAGGAGVFGNEEFPMSHNAFLDYLFIGGVPYLLISIIAIGYAVRGCIVCIRCDYSNQAVHRSCLWFFVLFLANMPFASGMQFQPVLGGAFYAILGWYLAVPKKMMVRRIKK